MKNPVIATVSFAAFAVFSLATISYYYKKNKKLNESILKNKNSLDTLKYIQEAKKSLEVEILSLKQSNVSKLKEIGALILQGNEESKSAQTKINQMKQNLNIATDEFENKIAALNVDLEEAEKQNSLDKDIIADQKRKITEFPFK